MSHHCRRRHHLITWAGDWLLLFFLLIVAGCGRHTSELTAMLENDEKLQVIFVRYPDWNLLNSATPRQDDFIEGVPLDKRSALQAVGSSHTRRKALRYPSVDFGPHNKRMDFPNMKDAKGNAEYDENCMRDLREGPKSENACVETMLVEQATGKFLVKRLMMNGSITRWNDSTGQGLTADSKGAHIIRRDDCSARLLDALKGKAIGPDSPIRAKYDVDGSNAALNVDIP